ncbi:MAG: GLPGLI family protein [Bacteroidetes bacterium]|nr:MAG: GLPGLI family protein [Bacteroidota bacterium]
MKHLVVFLFFLLPYSMGVAQSIFVEYEEIRGVERTVNYLDTWITDSVTTYKGRHGNLKETSFVKKKKEGFLYDTEKYHRTKFYVKDSLHNFKWELLPDTATILKRKCLSAKTTFRGREYKVFYTPEIPVSDGPWKFGGLPGLILEVKSTDDFIEWRAMKLDLAYTGSIKYIDVSQHTYISWQTYTKQYAEALDKFIHSLRSNKEVLPTGTSTKYKQPSIELFHPAQSEGIDVVGE